SFLFIFANNRCYCQKTWKLIITYMRDSFTNLNAFLRGLLVLFAFFGTATMAGAAADDVSLNAILAPANGSCGNPSTPLRLVIGNPGTNSQSQVPVTVIVSGAGSTIMNDTLNILLPAGGVDTFLLSSVFNTSAGGTFTIQAYTNLASDSDRTNDTGTTTF